MIDAEKLTQFIKTSALPEVMKKAVIKIIEVANDDIRQDIYLHVEEFNKNAELIKQGKMPLSPEIAEWAQKEAKKIRLEMYQEGEKMVHDSEEKEMEQELNQILSK